jgi:hypothetical protein
MPVFNYALNHTRCTGVWLAPRHRCEITDFTVGSMKTCARDLRHNLAKIDAYKKGVHSTGRDNGLPSHAGEKAIPQTKLLEAEHGERLDTRETGAASRANSAMEAVGAVDRTTNRRG